MSNNTISDNWSLQDIALLFKEGIDESESHFITIDREKSVHEYNQIPYAVISIEALFDFLTDIVLRDQIIVDEEYEKFWKQYDSPLSIVSEAGLIRSFPFLNDFDRLNEPREEIVERLCVTDSLKKDHEENASGWEKNRIVPHEYLSQVLWGGAGMLARGLLHEQGNTPHPVRKNFFVEAGVSNVNDSVFKITNFMDEKRASISSALNNDDEMHSLKLNISPLPIRIIQESNSPKDLIKIALQLRDEYEELRNWLRCYQQSLSDGSYKDLIKFQNILRSISTYIDSMTGVVDSNTATYSAGIGVFKIAMKGQPTNAIKNQFGIRSMINKLIVGRSGVSELNKLLNFFGHKNTAIGMKVVEHFSK